MHKQRNVFPLLLSFYQRPYHADVRLWLKKRVTVRKHRRDQIFHDRVTKVLCTTRKKVNNISISSFLLDLSQRLKLHIKLKVFSHQRLISFLFFDMVLPLPLLSENVITNDGVECINFSSCIFSYFVIFEMIVCVYVFTVVRVTCQ